jgi:hypothetical protein
MAGYFGATGQQADIDRLAANINDGFDELVPLISCTVLVSRKVLVSD